MSENNNGNGMNLLQSVFQGCGCLAIGTVLVIFIVAIL